MKTREMCINKNMRTIFYFELFNQFRYYKYLIIESYSQLAQLHERAQIHLHARNTRMHAYIPMHIHLYTNTHAHVFT